MKKIICRCFIAVAFFLAAAGVSSFAQTEQVDLNALGQETQKRSDKPGEMTFIWWIPEEYWQASFTQNPSMTPAQIDDFLKVFRPYTLVAAVDGNMGSFGTVTYKTEAEIRGNLSVIDSAGNKYLPLGEEEINADIKGLLAMMKPAWANNFGPIGQNMHFFLFPGQNKEGRSIADAKKDGIFLVKLDEREFRWKLPLGSLLPSKICPTCGEKISGAYKFCPWDGTKLE
ncbi:MAG: hypothetical protein PHC54_05155 [Candidatus Omnitrophica bacterium]|nr:hypothetical protein [Candidatus Omnitrophota bacterium]MDD5592710.1 hypothetical protein [Candidatus Omnitrophota bacterium]